MSDRHFQPTIERVVRDQAHPTRSVVICWPPHEDGLIAALDLLAPEAVELGVEVIVATSQPLADGARDAKIVRAPVAPDGDRVARRRAGFTHATGDVVALIDETTELSEGWLAAWFERAPEGRPAAPVKEIDA